MRQLVAILFVQLVLPHVVFEEANVCERVDILRKLDNFFLGQLLIKNSIVDVLDLLVTSGHFHQLTCVHALDLADLYFCLVLGFQLCVHLVKESVLQLVICEVS